MVSYADKGMHNGDQSKNGHQRLCLNQWEEVGKMGCQTCGFHPSYFRCSHHSPPQVAPFYLRSSSVLELDLKRT